MGSNSEIKKFDYLADEEMQTLFPTRKSKLAAFRGFLKSPWINRASSLLPQPPDIQRQGVRLRARPGAATADPAASSGNLAAASAHLGKSYRQPIRVGWDPQKKRPTSFTWRRRIYYVEKVLSVWVVEKDWWDPDRQMDCYYARVVSSGGIYDLLFDRIEKRWFLEGMAD